MGCPAGIGPEIILRLHQERQQLRQAAGVRAAAAEVAALAGGEVVVLGDIGVLADYARRLDLAVTLKLWQPGSPLDPAALNIVSLSTLEPLPEPGHPTPAGGRAMGGYIEQAVALVRQGELAAMVTCPISKELLNAGGYHYPGHTEMLAALCNSAEYAMMMAGNRLRVTLVSIHRSLAEVPGAVTAAAVGRLIRLTAAALRRDFAIARPRIAVAGLNPHAGEGGMFGAEEVKIIVPAVAEAAAMAGEHFTVSGPWPPDTVFYRAAQGDFDAVVAMYHDQGLIPFKLLHFKDGVNVTIGLPLVRTSVDHGTAYDIAGKGLADHASLRAAVAMAAQITVNRSQVSGNTIAKHRG